MKMILPIYIILLVLWSNIIEGKPIVNTAIWSPATRIYQINFQTTGLIQIEESKPTLDLLALEIAKSIAIVLPGDITAIKDLTVFTGDPPILFALTTTGQLLGIDLATQQIKLRLELAKFFGKTNNFSGTLTAWHKQASAGLMVTANANSTGMLVLEWLPGEYFNYDELTKTARVILAPTEIYKVITSAKIFASQLTRKIFTGVQTANNYAIWEIDLHNTSSKILNKTIVNSAPTNIQLLAFQPEDLTAFAMYNTTHLWLKPYVDNEQSSNLASLNISRENIQHVMIGPSIINGLPSCYIVNKTTNGNYITSNNFNHQVLLSNNAAVFLRHNELIFSSIKDNTLRSVHNKTGKTKELSILHKWEKSLNINYPVDNAAFLFWEPEQKQHVLLTIENNSLYLWKFKLTFDKPKILSWRRVNTM